MRPFKGERGASGAFFAWCGGVLSGVGIGYYTAFHNEWGVGLMLAGAVIGAVVIAT